MQVLVTKEHINAGQKCSCCRCPIALALKEVFKANYVSVGATTIWISKGINIEKEYKIPKKAKDFIDRFDRGLKVKPFALDLE